MKVPRQAVDDFCDAVGVEEVDRARREGQLDDIAVAIAQRAYRGNLAHEAVEISRRAQWRACAFAVRGADGIHAESFGSADVERQSRGDRVAVADAQRFDEAGVAEVGSELGDAGITSVSAGHIIDVARDCLRVRDGRGCVHGRLRLVVLCESIALVSATAAPFLMMHPEGERRLLRSRGGFVRTMRGVHSR